MEVQEKTRMLKVARGQQPHQDKDTNQRLTMRTTLLIQTTILLIHFYLHKRDTLLVVVLHRYSSSRLRIKSNKAGIKASSHHSHLPVRILHKSTINNKTQIGRMTNNNL